jgi:hypothetical protein
MDDDILIWQFGDDFDEGWRQLPPTPRRSPARVLLTLLGLVVLMTLAGLGGYVIGRQQRVMSLARADLQAVIDLETWAARAGNEKLFRSLLDPGMGPDWRRDLEEEFGQARDRIRQATIEGLSLDGDLARVVVRVLDANGERREVRFYRLVNGEWKRTAPRPESG